MAGNKPPYTIKLFGEGIEYDKISKAVLFDTLYFVCQQLIGNENPKEVKKRLLQEIEYTKVFRKKVVNQKVIHTWN